MDHYSTPILLLIFNRPQNVKKLIDHLRVIKPSKIYVGADGPRADRLEDQEKCALSRRHLDNIDWPCDIITQFYDQNLGCRNAVNESISWFFSQEEAGVILEDDCLPDPSFFQFAEKLLIKYKDSPKVMHIGGDNPISSITSSLDASYTFVSMPLVWGWATWRGAWAKMNLNLSGFQDFDFATLPLDRLSQKYIHQKFVDTQARNNDSWAYAWYFSILQNQGLCVLPKVNLVQNIGFNEESTHTKGANKTRELNSQSLTFPLKHPKQLQINTNIEQNLFHAAQKSNLGLLARQWLPRWLRMMLGAKK